jgi:Glycosyl hydrolases family 2, TIM barrel domain
MLAPPDKDGISDPFDVLMLHRYYDWYVDTVDLAAAERHLEAELDAWVEKHGKPIIMTEYGADTLGGLHGITPVPWERGVPDSTAGDVASRLRPRRRRRRRADLELRRLRHDVGPHARLRQQEGRLHPRPAPEGRDRAPAPALARSFVSARRAS